MALKIITHSFCPHFVLTLSSLCPHFDLTLSSQQKKEKTPRKFGTDLTHSSIGNFEKKSAHQSNRSATKKISTVKKPKSKSSFTHLSPHYEDFKSPPEIKSRFHSKRNATSRNLELEGSLREAEKSVQSAINFAQHSATDGTDYIQDRNGSASYTPNNTISSVVRNNHHHNHHQPNLISNNSSNDSRSYNLSGSASASKRSLYSPPSPSIEYTVDFEPGSIGLKVEPVIKNGNKEFGCRVMKFVEAATSSPSQAKKSGKIKVGHVMTAVNGTNVTSKSYADIVSILAECKSEGKTITFRVPRSPLQISETLSSYSQTSSALSRSPKYSSPETTKDESQHHDPEDTPPTMFSPSFVKKMSRTTIQDHFPTPINAQPVKTVSDVLSNVVKNIAPEPNNHDENLRFVPNMLSKRISEVLTGSHSDQFDEAVQMKMELLTELSQAKATLGEQEENIKKMEEMVNTLNQEKITIRSEKEVAESTLTDIQRAKVRFVTLAFITHHKKGLELIFVSIKPTPLLLSLSLSLSLSFTGDYR